MSKRTPSEPEALDLAIASFDPEEASEVEDSDFRGLALDLVAALVQADGYLLLDEYQAYLRSAEELVGAERMQIPTVRASVFESIASSTDDDGTIEDELVSRLSAVIAKARVAYDARLRLARAMLEIAESSPQVSARPLSLLRKCLETLSVREPDLDRRLKVLEYGSPTDSEADSPGISGVIRVGGLIAKAKATLGVGQKLHRLEYSSEASIKNSEARALIQECRDLASTIGSEALKEAAEELEGQLRAQPFRIVIFGEFKHGKSSLFNAIAGEKLSEEGESLPTTAAIIELRHSEEATYEGEWVDEDRIAAVRSFVGLNRDNGQVAAFSEHFEAVVACPVFEAGTSIAGLSSFVDAIPYVTRGGTCSPAVKRVRFGLPVPALQSGAVLVDTPGLNDPMSYRTDISLEEVDRADVVLFLVRADKLGSASERDFLQRMARSSRVLHLVPVITFIDRVTDREAALAATQELLREILGNSGIRLENPVALNAASVARELTEADAPRADPDSRHAFEALLEVLKVQASDKKRDSEYVGRLKARIKDLRKSMTEAKDRFVAESLARLPESEILDLLAQHAKRFETLTEQFRSQVRSRLESLRDGILTDSKSFDRLIDEIRESATQHLAAEIEKQVRELGDKEYAKKEHWEDFPKTVGVPCIQGVVERLQERHREIIDRCHRDAERFSESVLEEVNAHLHSLEQEQAQLVELMRERTALTYLTCEVDEALSKISKLALTSGGTLALGALSLGMAAAVLQVAAVVLTNPFFLAAIASGLIFKLKADAGERKQRFIDQRLESVREKWLEPTLDEVRAEHREQLEEAWSVFRDIALSSYLPLIRQSHASAREARGYVLTLQRLRSDTVRFRELEFGTAGQ